MSTVVQIPPNSGSTQIIPAVGDTNWGQYTTATLIALAQYVFPKNGGNYFLTGDVNFGTSFGLFAAYFTSSSPIPATNGEIRLARTDSVSWRNSNNTDNLALSVDSSNNLNWTGEINASEFNSSSDAALKKNVEPIEDALAKVLKLNGVTFDWRDNNESSAGVIAQHVEKVLPEIVTKTDHLRVNYNGLTALLIEAVKELSGQVNSLKDELNKRS